MKKSLVVISICLLASALWAAGATKAKTAKPAQKTANKKTEAVAKEKMELVVVQAPDYLSGQPEGQIILGLANHFQAEPVVTVVDVEQAKQIPALANLDYSFLPLYMAKKTPKLREQVAQYIQAGAIVETEEYLVFPGLSSNGVYTNKTAQPGVLEIFVMSQCPYGVMAENLVIEAFKAGKVPADKIIRLRYIVNYNDKNGQFQSLHGSGEWEEDVRQLLIAKYYPTKLWKYLEIRNKDYHSSRWDKAMEEAGINVKKITKKFDTEGLELLKTEAAYGREYAINASPSFLWEGKEKLDFGSVHKKEGFDFLNPAAGRANRGGAPVGSC